MTDSTRGKHRRGWQRWHFFAIAVAAVAIIGGIWNVVTEAPPAPEPGPTRTLIIDDTPEP